MIGPRRAGFSMVELMVAVAILTVAIFGTLAALALSGGLRQTSRDTELALQELQERLEEYRAMDRDAVVATIYGTQLNAFSIPAERLVNGAGTVFVLSEAQASQAFQCDLDLDGALDPTGADRFDLDGDGFPGEAGGGPGGFATQAEAEAYTRLIPIRVSVSWDPVTGGGAAGQRRTVSAETILYPTSTN